MNEEEFSELSAKVLVGDASAEELVRHESACKQDADFKASFEEMKVASGILEENAPLASSIDAQEPAIPEFLLEKLVGELDEEKNETKNSWAAFPDSFAPNEPEGNSKATGTIDFAPQDLHRAACLSSAENSPDLESSSNSSKESPKSKSNITSFWKYATIPLAAAFAFALYINQVPEPTGGSAVSNEVAEVSESMDVSLETEGSALVSKPLDNHLRSNEPSFDLNQITGSVEGYELAYTNIRSTSISDTTGGPLPYEFSMGVQFGSWQEGVVRGGDETYSWLPSAIKPAFYNNKKERAEWIQAQSESIRVWIDEDEAKIMVFRPWVEAPSSIELLPDSAGQRDQLIQLLNQLSFPSRGVKYIVSENDTLDGISKALNSRSDWIIHANGLDKNLPLEQGSTVFVPQAD
jgi:hypothetical protein